VCAGFRMAVGLRERSGAIRITAHSAGGGAIRITATFQKGE